MWEAIETLLGGLIYGKKDKEYETISEERLLALKEKWVKTVENGWHPDEQEKYEPEICKDEEGDCLLCSLYERDPSWPDWPDNRRC